MYFLTPLRSQSPFPTQHLNQCAVLWAFKGNQMAVASQFGCHFVFPGALGWVFRCGQSIGAAPLLVGEGPTEREAPHLASAGAEAGHLAEVLMVSVQMPTARGGAGLGPPAPAPRLKTSFPGSVLSETHSALS